MANSEHLKILKQGIEVWNQWREDNPKVTPDFQGAILQGANLKGADLKGANLQHADLHGANLWGASLQNAHLIGADVSNVVLWEVDLAKTVFLDGKDSPLILDGADLWEANLKKTCFPSLQAMEKLARPLSVEQQRDTIYLDNTQQIVEEPFIELTEQALKAKRNLIILIVLSFVLAVGLLDIAQFKPLGFKLKDGNEIWLYVGTMVATVYFMVTLYLTGWETFQKWKLRRTGVGEAILKKVQDRGGFARAGQSIQQSNSRALGEKANRKMEQPVVEQHTAYADIHSTLDDVRSLLKAETTDMELVNKNLEQIKMKEPLLIHLTKKFNQHQSFIVKKFIIEFHVTLGFGLLAFIALACRMFILGIGKPEEVSLFHCLSPWFC
ncbi:pentapeptide repeat-containing protein [Pseudodesulfovibrio sediminis]|uniref:Pentapeptide repeat-containing protein n=1 Tax=Pseudodesulfovibrio sediminis TaxID=2810563 RepID=A0ABN6EPZ1_9BACT|nr:pentapeptide repeat-containing protein [Pseudodesulfovibrio sediminis]BCS87363.1 hypothetical protein PSDVSF_06050 [Pseudodesulfovibrio sediminis]